jgi:membrane-bound acyltransferase YfiQ involved in biofilm formation
MPWQAWFDIPFLQKIWKHTSNCAAAMGSWIFLFWLGRKGIQSDRIRLILEYTETVVLIVTIAVFAFDFVSELIPQRVRSLFYNVGGWLRNVFHSNRVLA